MVLVVVVTSDLHVGMFPSGKAVITGAVRWEEVRQSYEFARAVLCDHFDYLKVLCERN
jgi:hypothetical protein